MVRTTQGLSEPLEISCGLGQGLVVGPLFWSLFQNDQPSVLKHTQPHYFADDSQYRLTGNISAAHSMIALLNDDLNSVCDWSTYNGMRLNAEKTQCICFSRKPPRDLPNVTINSVPAPFQDSVKYLGVILDQRLSFEPFINQICSRIYFNLRQLYKLKPFLSQDLRLVIIRSYVLPFLYYGDILYFSAKRKFLKKLERALNSCTRFVFDLRRYDRLSNHRNILLGRSFHNHLKLRVCLFIFKILFFKQPAYLFNEFNLTISRRANMLLIPNYKSNYYNSSLFVAGIRIWNSLPRNIRMAGSVAVFRRLASDHFSD